MNMTPRDIIEDLFKHRTPLILFSIIVIIFTLVYAFGAKETFTSEAQILVRLGQEQMGSLQFMNASKNVYVTRREQELKNEETIFLSDKVLEATVEEILGYQDKGRAKGERSFALGQNQTENCFSTFCSRGFQRWNSWFSSSKEEDPRVGVKEYIKDKLSVEPLYDSDALSVSFDFPDPGIAQRVLSILIDKYVAHHINVYRSKNETGLVNFKLKESRAKYDEALTAYTEFIDKHKMFDDKQIEILVGKRNQLLSTIADIRAEHEFHKQKLEKSLEEIKKLAPYEKYNTVVVTNDRRKRLKGKLNDARLEKQNLAQKYTKNSRLIADIDKEIDTLRQLIAEEPNRVVDSVDNRKNSGYDELKKDIVNLKTTVAGEKARLDSLLAEVESLTEELSKNTRNYQKFNLLKKDLELAKVTYERYYDGFLESDLSSVSQELNVTNLSIVEEPSFNPLPTKPKKKKLFIFSGLFLVAGNAFLLLFLIMKNTTVGKPDDLQRALKQKVMGTLPMVQELQSHHFGRSKKSLTLFKTHVKEFQLLSINLLLEGRGDKMFLVGRSRTGEGGGTIAFNLAQFMGYSRNKKIAFVEYTSSGLAALILRGEPVADGMFQKLTLGKVDCYRYRGGEKNGYGDLDAKYNYLSFLKEKYDYVFCNIPPVQDSVDLVFLNKHIDRVLFFIEAEQTKLAVIKHNISLLKQYGLAKISFILNKRMFYIPKALYKYV